MTESVYRDPNAALVERIGALQNETIEREASIARVVSLEHFSGEVREKIAEYKYRVGRLLAETEPPFAMIESLLREYLAYLETLAEDAPRVRGDLVSADGDAPDPFTDEGYVFGEVLSRDEKIVAARIDRAIVEFAEHVSWRSSRRPPEIELSIVYPTRVSVKFLRGDARFAFGASVIPELREALNCAATRVPLAMPKLKLEPRGLLNSIAVGLGLSRDVIVGDDEFDDTFRVDAESTAAHSILTPRVRELLVRLSYFDLPTLIVGGGEARVQFRYDPTSENVRLALDILVEIRSVDVSAMILADPSDDGTDLRNTP